MSPHDTPRMLMITNVERGQANVFLAVAAALLANCPSLHLHFASFSSLEKDVAQVSTHARQRSESVPPIAFHALCGLTMEQAITGLRAARCEVEPGDYLPASHAAAPRGFCGTVRAMRDTVPIFIPYTGPELVEVYQSVVDTVQAIGPDLIVIDSLMTPALTACIDLGVPWVCLSPNAIKDFAHGNQPFPASLANFCQIPALFSRFRYPVPWRFWLRNVFFKLYAMRTYLGSTHRRQVAEYFHADTGVVLSTPFDLMRLKESPVKILVGSLAALDFPLVVPKHIFPCGPIALRTSLVADTDLELDGWLGKGPTIYINLGSLHRTSEELAVQMAQALSIVLGTAIVSDESRPLQVLWKLKQHGPFDVLTPGCRIHSILGDYAAQGRVRIVEWIAADPSSILDSPNVVCAVHHGGANSYNEAILSGVRQVVLPQWLDCYDYAERVELLGVGKHGSRMHSPSWDAIEVSEAILEVVGSPRAHAFFVRARHFASVCRENGDGAGNAARNLLQECAQFRENSRKNV